MVSLCFVFSDKMGGYLVVILFGSCLLVHVNEDGHALNLSSVEWKQIYEKLFGGFEDIGDNDTEESDELDLESEELIATTLCPKQRARIEKHDIQQNLQNASWFFWWYSTGVQQTRHTTELTEHEALYKT